MKKEINVKPFVKWAGGKTQLLSEIQLRYPENIEKYCEPFVGGGAVLFDILNKYSPKELLINDINPELINTYEQIKCNVNEIVKCLTRLQDIYINNCGTKRSDIYYKCRVKFNDLIVNGKTKSEKLQKAVLFIFLNRTCFNGLYRVNAEGLFNVPEGKYKNPLICDSNNLLKISKKLKNVKIINADFEKCEDFIDENTFVYLDPPYRPLSETSSFIAYTKFQFNDDEQIRLGKFIDKISKKGAKIVLSNSDPKNVNSNDNFFDELYNNYKIERIDAKRMINSNANKRGNVKELLIANY